MNILCRSSTSWKIEFLIVSKNIALIVFIFEILLIFLVFSLKDILKRLFQSCRPGIPVAPRALRFELKPGYDERHRSVLLRW